MDQAPSANSELGTRDSEVGGAGYAEVVVNSGQPARMAFTYAVPEGLGPVAGQAVFVPYGPKVLQGIVLSLAPTTELAEVRPIAAIADPEPAIDVTRISLARWLSAKYLAPLWDCVSVCLPSGYGQKAVTMVSPIDIPVLLPIYPEDQRILQYIAANGRVTSVQAPRIATRRTDTSVSVHDNDIVALGGL